MNTTTIKHEVLNHLTDNARIKVNYYSTLFDPEHEHNHGFSVAKCLEMAQTELDKTQEDVKDYKHWLNNGRDPFNFIAETDMINLTDSLKQVIRERIRIAIDFPDNYLIRWTNYRAAVYCKHWLDKLKPEYKQFTARHFLRYN